MGPFVLRGPGLDAGERGTFFWSHLVPAGAAVAPDNVAEPAPRPQRQGI